MANGQLTLKIQNQRLTYSAPQLRMYKVVYNDSLWSIAKKIFGNGNRFIEIYTLNREMIDERNRNTGLSIYTIYVGQILMLPV